MVDRAKFIPRKWVSAKCLNCKKDFDYYRYTRDKSYCSAYCRLSYYSHSVVGSEIRRIGYSRAYYFGKKKKWNEDNKARRRVIDWKAKQKQKLKAGYKEMKELNTKIGYYKYREGYKTRNRIWKVSKGTPEDLNKDIDYLKTQI